MGGRARFIGRLLPGLVLASVFDPVGGPGSRALPRGKAAGARPRFQRQRSRTA